MILSHKVSADCIQGIILLLFITLLDKYDSCFRETGALFSQLSLSTVFKPQSLHNRAVCVCVRTTANGFSKARVGQRVGERGEDKGQDKERRLDEDQTQQMCRTGTVRSESEDDERRLDCLKASAVTASTHSQLLAHPLS